MDAERPGHALCEEGTAACSFDPAWMPVGAGGCCVGEPLEKLLFAPLRHSRTIRQFSAFVFSLLYDPAQVSPAAERHSVHRPVMPREVLHALKLQPGLTVLDGTVGGGGHSSLILSAIGATGKLIAMDRDPMMLEFAERVLSSAAAGRENCHLIQANYITAATVLSELGISGVDRVLLDLGLSSDQLADADRGFGFAAGGYLDMRYDRSTGFPAAELLRKLSEQELTDIFLQYGEVPAAGRVAAEIVRRRMRQAVQTADQLEDCVCEALGVARGSGHRNPATRVFQALRIAANQELQHVEQMLNAVLPHILNTGGIAAILTFQSLEDRIVKSAFKGHHGWEVLTKTPIVATPAEIRLNPRSRSAKLRSAMKR